MESDTCSSEMDLDTTNGESESNNSSSPSLQSDGAKTDKSCSEYYLPTIAKLSPRRRPGDVRSKRKYTGTGKHNYVDNNKLSLPCVTVQRKADEENSTVKPATKQRRRTHAYPRKLNTKQINQILDTYDPQNFQSDISKAKSAEKDISRNLSLDAPAIEAGQWETSTTVYNYTLGLGLFVLYILLFGLIWRGVILHPMYLAILKLYPIISLCILCECYVQDHSTSRGQPFAKRGSNTKIHIKTDTNNTKSNRDIQNRYKTSTAEKNMYRDLKDKEFQPSEYCTSSSYVETDSSYPTDSVRLNSDKVRLVTKGSQFNHFYDYTHERHFRRYDFDQKGGRITDMGIGIQISEGTFEGTTPIIICKTERPSDKPILPPSTRLVSGVYHCFPHRYSFQQPIVLSIDLEQTINPQNIVLMYSGTDINEETNWVTIKENAEYNADLPFIVCVENKRCTFVMKTFCLLCCGAVEDATSTSPFQENYLTVAAFAKPEHNVYPRMFKISLVLAHRCEVDLVNAVKEAAGDLYGTYLDHTVYVLSETCDDLQFTLSNIRGGWALDELEEKEKRISFSVLNQLKRAKVSYYFSETNPASSSGRFALAIDIYQDKSLPTKFQFSGSFGNICSFNVMRNHEMTQTFQSHNTEREMKSKETKPQTLKGGSNSKSRNTNQNLPGVLGMDSAKTENADDLQVVPVADLSEDDCSGNWEGTSSLQRSDPSNKNVISITSECRIENQTDFGNSQQIHQHFHLSLPSPLTDQLARSVPSTPALAHSARMQIAQEMDPEHPLGHDWRYLAEALGVANIEYIKSIGGSPTLTLLNIWESNTGGDYDRLREAFRFSKRERVARLLPAAETS